MVTIEANAHVLPFQNRRGHVILREIRGHNPITWR